jgi:hypothetical protein
MQIRHLTEKLTATDIIVVQEDNEVLCGMHFHAEVWRDLDYHHEEERDLKTTISVSDKGRGKWKRITEKLFKSRILKPLLIALTVKHIGSNVYTAYSVMCVLDLQHGFIICGSDNLRNIEHAVPRAERLLWSVGMGIQFCNLYSLVF